MRLAFCFDTSVLCCVRVLRRRIPRELYSWRRWGHSPQLHVAVPGAGCSIWTEPYALDEETTVYQGFGLFNTKHSLFFPAQEAVFAGRKSRNILGGLSRRVGGKSKAVIRAFVFKRAASGSVSLADIDPVSAGRKTNPVPLTPVVPAHLRGCILSRPTPQEMQACWEEVKTSLRASVFSSAALRAEAETTEVPSQLCKAGTRASGQPVR